jgi:hypothetical protein
MSRVIVILPGGFHPFHAGHYALYQSAQQAFPNADVYVAASDDTSNRPFPFVIKEKLARVAGVQPGQFVQVKSPFRSHEITQKYNENEDILIFVRSEKDRNENPKPGGNKKDGSPAYYQPYTGKDLQPFVRHAYFAYLPTVEFGPGITSATEIRNLWPRLDARKKMALVMSMYPKTKQNQKLAQVVVGLIDQGMGSAQQLDEKEEKTGVDYIKDRDPTHRDILRFAKRHYPEMPDLQSAFIKYVIRSLKHSEEDSEKQSQEIEELQKEVDEIHSVIDQLKRVNEGMDYVQEK